MRRLPAGYLEQLLEDRAYRHAKQVYDRTEKKLDLLAQGDRWIQLVAEIDAEEAQEELDERTS